MMDFYSRGLHSFTTLDFAVVEISRSVSVSAAVESEGQDLQHCLHRLYDDSPMIFSCDLAVLHNLDQFDKIVAMFWFRKVSPTKGEWISQ
jgi:hypothetical protein